MDQRKDTRSRRAGTMSAKDAKKKMNHRDTEAQRRQQIYHEGTKKTLIFLN